MAATDLAVPLAVPARVGRDSRLTRQRTRAAWLFVAPMLLVLAAVAGWPLLRTIWFAFTDANLADLSIAQFIGFANFQYLLTDPDWWVAVRNTMVFTVCLGHHRDHPGPRHRPGAERPLPGPRPAARRRPDPLGDPDRGLGADVVVDVQRRVRDHQRHPA